MLEKTLIVFHLIFCVVLGAVVLMQSGKEDGLSGTITGGAETFFGKSKGRTLDQILKRWTTVVAILFLVSSVLLSMLLKSV